MNILIIEDEYSLADAIAETLKKEKFHINIQTNGEDGENEADDYITKPFSTRELVARIKIILKRVNNIEDTSILKFGDLTLDIKNAKVKCQDNEIQIGGKELKLLEQLLINKNQVSIRENLAQRIWGYESDAEYNNVEVSLTSIILGVTALYSILSYKDSINSATMMMDRLTGDDGKKLERPQEMVEVDGIYKFSIDNNFKIFKETQETSDEIKNYAITVSKGISESGMIGKYVYNYIHNIKKVSKTIVKPVEETLERQKQFISDASHELKTPLAVTTIGENGRYNI